MKKKPQKIIAIVLAIISLVSMFNIGILAGYFSGSPSNGGGTPSNSADEQFKIRGYKGDINRPQGYRFSIIDAGGNTLKNGSKFRTIDILRTGANDASKLQYKLNKYQIRAKYVDPNGNINLNLGDSGTAAYGKKFEEELSNISQSLPDTSGIGSWIENATNRNAVLSAVGYSGALNTNRIVIEPLYCISYNGYFMILTVSEMALMNIHYKQGNTGNAYTTGNYTNYYFPVSLMLVSGKDTDLGLSVKAYKKSGSKSQPYTNDEIIKNGLGMALYYEKNSDGTPKMPNNTHTMTIFYHKNDGSGIITSCSYVIENSNTMVDIYSPALLNIVSDKDFGKDGYGFEGWATSGYNTEIEILCVIYN